jgi:uncharacterized membrane protein
MTALNRWPQVFISRPRLWSSFALGLAVFWLLPQGLAAHTATRTLLAWNACALSYLGLALHMMWRADRHKIQGRAIQQSEGRWLVLTMVVVAAVAVLLAVGSQLSVVNAAKAANLMTAQAKLLHVALGGFTVITAWLFTQTLMATHYAHDFYLLRANGRHDGLTFPGTTDPGYGDFFYFAAIIGTSGQTADVSFNGSDMRPVGTVHCILAFFFNTTVLALTINTAAGLF